MSFPYGFLPLIDIDTWFSEITWSIVCVSSTGLCLPHKAFWLTLYFSGHPSVPVAESSGFHDDIRYCIRSHWYNNSDITRSTSFSLLFFYKMYSCFLLFLVMLFKIVEVMNKFSSLLCCWKEGITMRKMLFKKYSLKGNH